jgi:hypothetical protein
VSHPSARAIAIVAGTGVIVAVVGVLLELGHHGPPATCPPAPVAAVASALGADTAAPGGVIFGAAVAQAEQQATMHAEILATQVLESNRGGGITTASVVLTARGPSGTYAIPESLTLSCASGEWVLDG